LSWEHVCRKAGAFRGGVRKGTAKIKTLPEILRASLTWDQGPEMRDWKQVAVDADIDIFFCDPHAPWQRATNENTNGLLRQYFPKGTDLSIHSAEDLDWVRRASLFPDCGPFKVHSGRERN
jgi:IS30 family transposase